MTLQKIFFFFSLVFLLSSCNSALDKTFDAERYAIDIDIIQRQNRLSLSDLILLNYAVLRQNDYFNYSIEGMTYQEILELAKTLKKDGLDFEETFNDNSQGSPIEAKLWNEGTGVIRTSPKSKRFIKVLKFRGEFTNLTSEDIVLLNTTIQVKGPFRKFITSAGYDLNCLLQPGNYIKVDFILDAKNVRDNIQFHNKYQTPKFFIDSLVANSTFHIAGTSTTANKEFFEHCVFDGQRIEPFRYFDCEKDFDTEKQIIKEGDKTLRIEYGDAHFIIEDNDKIINM